MERQLPRNVRQIGNISDTPKIYVEDYVDTFFTQLCDKAQQEPVGAFLVGEMQTTDGEDYVFIHGAIQMHDLKMEGKDLVIDDQAWKSGYEDCKQYFEDSEIVGWFVARLGPVLTLDHSILKLHRKSFSKKNTILVLKDPVEKEEVYYAHKFDDLMEIGGHYTYYEKNPSMQNYMISSRKRNGVCPSETVEDRAAKDFRSMIRSREEQQEQKRAARMMYMASAVLILVVVVMGVTTINNFDKMQTVETALQSVTMGGQGEQGTNKTENMEPVVDQSAEGQAQDVQKNSVIEKEESSEQEFAGAQKEDSETVVSSEKEDKVQETSGNIVAAGNGQDVRDTITQEDAEKENGNDGVYVVEEGDTLAIISKKMYGDVGHVDAICKMNGLSDGNFIYIGQKLVLP
ncbi:MAG: LysM peptidoglycan-binding domain-containing protein [Hespellia sp.]|jgi:LysM repeat protein|nr:LysM peptidoglycan-binding domain-containing protein [Hespellia sp.]